MKRFTETTKWKDIWFRTLTPPAKILWLYIQDECDAAGIIELDLEAVTFFSGVKINDSHVAELSGRLSQISSTKYLIIGYIQFQYGKLSRDCKPHKPAFDSLAKHGISEIDIAQNEKYSEVVSSELRRKIIERDNSTCVYTGKHLFDWEIAIDHVLCRSKGGTNDPSNLVVMDSKLNTMKKDLSVEEFCEREKLNYQEVSERLSMATKKGFKSLQEKEKEKDKVQEGGTGGRKHPTIEEVKAFCETRKLPESDAVWFWNKCEGNGWTNSGRPIKSWTCTIAAWESAGYMPSQKNNDKNNLPKPKTLLEKMADEDTRNIRRLERELGL